MSKYQKLFEKILLGSSDSNIDFEELKNLLIKLGFVMRINGSHHVFSKDNIEEIINIQPLKDKKAKPYQIKQVRELIIEHNLKIKK